MTIDWPDLSFPPINLHIMPRKYQNTKDEWFVNTSPYVLIKLEDGTEVLDIGPLKDEEAADKVIESALHIINGDFS